MQVEVVVTMGRRHAIVHGHRGRPIGPVEFADGTIGEYGAKEVRYADYI